jgi:hypothetical protein
MRTRVEPGKAQTLQLLLSHHDLTHRVLMPWRDLIISLIQTEKSALALIPISQYLQTQPNVSIDSPLGMKITALIQDLSKHSNPDLLMRSILSLQEINPLMFDKPLRQPIAQLLKKHADPTFITSILIQMAHSKLLAQHNPNALENFNKLMEVKNTWLKSPRVLAKLNALPTHQFTQEAFDQLVDLTLDQLFLKVQEQQMESMLSMMIDRILDVPVSAPLPENVDTLSFANFGFLSHRATPLHRGRAFTQSEIDSPSSQTTLTPASSTLF